MATLNINLIKACQRKEKPAQKQLYEIYVDRLFSIARRYCNDDSSTKDIIQNSFINIFKNIHQLHDVNALEGWMKKITINCAIAAYKKQKKVRFDSDLICVTEDLFVAPIVEDLLNIEDLLSEVEALPDLYKIVLKMYAVDELKHTEIGEILSISSTLSRTRLTRARQMLLKRINKNQNLHYVAK